MIQWVSIIFPNEIIDDGESMYKKAVENYPFARNANRILANMH